MRRKFYLKYFLDEEKAQLSWDTRMKIAIGIAQGLRYLHSELQPPFSLSELNSNSVYLTEDYTPKVWCAHSKASTYIIIFCDICQVHIGIT
jgi:hypothetical protein